MARTSEQLTPAEILSVGTIASMPTNKLLGRSTAGTGAVEVITLGTNLSFTGTTLNAAGGGSFSWNATASGTSGTGVGLTLNNSSSAGAIGESITIGNTQTQNLIGLSIDTGTSTTAQQALKIKHLNGASATTSGISINSFAASTQAVGTEIGMLIGANFNDSSAISATMFQVSVSGNGGAGQNTGIYVSNSETALGSFGVGAGVRIVQDGVDGTGLYILGNANVNSSTNGLANFVLSSTQSAASVVQKIDLSTSAQGHTGIQLRAYGASTSQRGITIDTSSTGTGIPLEFITAGTGRTAFKLSTGFTTSTAPTGASTYVIVDIGGTAYKILAQVS